MIWTHSHTWTKTSGPHLLHFIKTHTLLVHTRGLDPHPTVDGRNPAPLSGRAGPSSVGITVDLSEARVS